MFSWFWTNSNQQQKPAVNSPIHRKEGSRLLLKTCSRSYFGFRPGKAACGGSPWSGSPWSRGPEETPRILTQCSSGSQFLASQSSAGSSLGSVFRASPGLKSSSLRADFAAGVIVAKRGTFASENEFAALPFRGHLSNAWFCQAGWLVRF